MGYFDSGHWKTYYFRSYFFEPAVATPTPTPTPSAPPQPGGGALHGRFWSRADRREDRDVVYMVRRVIEDEIRRHAPSTPPEPPWAVEYEPASEAEIGEAITRLGASSSLREVPETRAALEQAFRELEEERHRAFLFAKAANDSRADDEAALLAILRLV